MYKLVDLPEYNVDFCVLVMVLPPPFNNSGIISVGEDAAARARQSGESVYEKLKAHCLCPSDVSFPMECFPLWYESPRTPMFSNDNSNADSRTCI